MDLRFDWGIFSGNSVFSKIYERIMHTRLVNHLESNVILHNSRYGLRAGHSCEHAILEA